MRMTYRTQRTLQRVGLVTVILLLLFIVAWFCSVVFLQRHVVYTRDNGAVLDLELSANDMVGEVAQPPVGNSDISIYYNEGADALNTSTELTRLEGYYITIEDMQNDMAGVWELLEPLASGTPIMVDLKGGYGSFLYSTTLPGTITSASVSVASVDEMIGNMNQKGFYTIARISAFRDYNYGLHHVPSGLMHVNRKGLWPDEGNCYWLNPNDAGTQAWLVSIVSELKNMGFDEVVLTDFRFPDSTQYIFDGDKDEALHSAAAALAKECLSESNPGFTLSFCVTSSSFVLPEGRTRMYLENISATNVGLVASQVEMESPDARLVFVTQANDTRFNAYGVLRPITASTVIEAQKATRD